MGRTERICNFFDQVLRILITILCLLALLIAAYAFYDDFYLSKSVDKFKPDDGDVYGMMMSLRGTNPDVVGWIEVDGTNISYPIVKGENNEYYLDHDAEKAFSNGGSIYMDSDNAADFSDFDTVLYGHNMSGRKMFSDLKLFSEEAFFQSHPKTVIFLPDRTLICENILYGQADGADPKVYGVPHRSDDAKSATLQRLNELSVYKREALQMTDSLITMSTCTVEDFNTRHILIAKVIEVKNAGQN